MKKKSSFLILTILIFFFFPYSVFANDITIENIINSQEIEEYEEVEEIEEFEEVEEIEEVEEFEEIEELYEVQEKNNNSLKSSKMSSFSTFSVDEEIETFSVNENSLDNVNVGDYIVIYNPSNNNLRYSQVLSIDPFIQFSYWVKDGKTGTIYIKNEVFVSDLDIYTHLKDCKIYGIIHNNSADINLDNVDLSIDNAEIIEKLDILQTSCYVLLFGIFALFGGLSATIFIKVLLKL